jgi:hypothetical protein
MHAFQQIDVEYVNEVFNIDIIYSASTLIQQHYCRIIVCSLGYRI